MTSAHAYNERTIARSSAVAESPRVYFIVIDYFANFILLSC